MKPYEMKISALEQGEHIYQIKNSYRLIKLEKEVFDYLEKEFDFLKVKKINVMVSGGSDSMALLYLINKFVKYKNDVYNHLASVNVKKKEFEPIELNAVYIHFQDFDNYELALQTVKDFCHDNSINFIVKESVITKDYTGNIKSTAREEIKRYAVENKPDVVFTGHHKDDNIETILYRILSGRGGITGFEGMKKKDYQNYFSYWCHFSKPFLDITKKEIVNYCRYYLIPYVEDNTNYELDSDRNFIRNKIIPVIQERFSIDNILKISKRMEWFLTNSRTLDLEKNEWDLEEFKKCGISIQADAILHKCKKLGFPLSNEKVKRLIQFLNHEFKTTKNNTGVYNIAEYKDIVLLLVWNKDNIYVTYTNVE